MAPTNPPVSAGKGARSMVQCAGSVSLWLWDGLLFGRTQFVGPRPAQGKRSLVKFCYLAVVGLCEGRKTTHSSRCA